MRFPSFQWNPITSQELIRILRYNIMYNPTTKGVKTMSVELYPDHKAILHFHNSLKVYEIDFLDYLTSFLTQDRFAERHFDIYVKPTLHYSAFDFVVVEPQQAIYIIQTPESIEQYQMKKEALGNFYPNHLQMLSPSLKKRLQRQSSNKSTQRAVPIKQFFYLYQEDLLMELEEVETANDVFVVERDFEKDPETLATFFEAEARTELTTNEMREIREILNPNTNIDNYVPKLLPQKYHEYTKSTTGSKQKFKGANNTGKSIILSKRVINCANRYKGDEKILVVAGDATKVNQLKDLITAESRKSLQELGVDVTSYQALIEPVEKYNALFVDDANFLEIKWLERLLDDFLIEMKPGANYEYVVMAGLEDLPQVPMIFGRFITLKLDLVRRTRMLNQSRKVFLDILNG